MFCKVLRVFLVFILLMGIISPVSSVFATMAPDSPYIDHTLLFVDDGPPISQDPKNPTEMWENERLEFWFTKYIYKQSASISLEIERAYNNGSEYHGRLPFNTVGGEDACIWFLLEPPDTLKDGGFPRSAIGKTMTITLTVNGTSSFYYIKAKSIEAWEDPPNPEDRVESAWILRDKENLVLSQDISNATVVEANDIIVIKLSSSMIGSTLSIAGRKNYIDYCKQLHLKVDKNGLVQFSIWQLDVEMTDDGIISLNCAKQTRGSLNSTGDLGYYQFLQGGYGYDFNNTYTFYIKLADAEHIPTPIPPVSITASVYNTENAGVGAWIGDEELVLADLMAAKAFAPGIGTKLAVTTDTGNIFRVTIQRMGDNVLTPITEEILNNGYSSEPTHYREFAPIYRDGNDGIVYSWDNTLGRNYNTFAIDISELNLPNGTYFLTCADTRDPEWDSYGGNWYPFVINFPSEAVLFPDVQTTHWAYYSIMALAEKGIVIGYTDGLFKPGKYVSRSEFAAMMVRALDIPIKADTYPTFSDVGKDRWDFAYVQTVKEYLTGYENDGKYYFKGDELAVREDMAIALVKALRLENELLSPNDAEIHLKQVFKDAGSISYEAYPYVLAAYELNLIGGYPGGTIGPQKPITRAEATVLLIRVINSELVEKVTFDQ